MHRKPIGDYLGSTIFITDRVFESTVVINMGELGDKIGYFNVCIPSFASIFVYFAEAQ